MLLRGDLTAATAKAYVASLDVGADAVGRWRLFRRFFFIEFKHGEQRHEFLEQFWLAATVARTERQPFDGWQLGGGAEQVSQAPALIGC